MAAKQFRYQKEQSMIKWINVALITLAFSFPASAGEPSALVEDVSDARTDVMLMDMLEPGQVIELGAGEKITLGYLSTCRQEVITGGKVTIGRDESAIAGGKVTAKKIACDSDKVAGAGNEAGAVVFRAPPNSGPVPKPDRTVYSLYPLLKTGPEISAGVLKRLDRNEKEKKIKFAKGVADFRKLKKKLARNGYYQITAGDHQAVFRVHPTAKSSAKAILSRFVVF